MTEEAGWSEPGVVTKISPRPVTGTVARLTDLLGREGHEARSR